jgi:hypothetical protein
MYLDEITDEIYGDLCHIKRVFIKKTIAEYFAGLPHTLREPYANFCVGEEGRVKYFLEIRSRNLIHLTCSELRRDNNFEEIEQFIFLPLSLITASVSLDKEKSLWYKTHSTDIEGGYTEPLKPVEDNLQELIEESKNFLKNSVDKNLIHRIMNRILNFFKS